MDLKGKYGLIIPSKEKKQPIFPSEPASLAKKGNVFGEESESEEDAVDWVKHSLKKQSNGSVQQKQSTQVMKKALKDDPTVYQYDELYDDMEKKREDTKEKQKGEKKPKYIGTLLKTAERRQREFEERQERDVQKEREAEGDMYKDKEAFVTGAYRKKMEELEKAKEDERRKDQIDELTDVTKQKDLSGFYRHLYRQQLGDQNADEISDKPKEADNNSEKQELETPTVKDERLSPIPNSQHHRDRLSPTPEKSSRRRSRTRTPEKTSRRRSRSRSPRTSVKSRSSPRRDRDRDRESRRSPVHQRHRHAEISSGRPRSRSKDRHNRHRISPDPRDRDRDKDRNRDRNRDQDRNRDRDRYFSQDRERDRDRDRNHDRDRNRDRESERKQRPRSRTPEQRPRSSKHEKENQQDGSKSKKIKTEKEVSDVPTAPGPQLEKKSAIWEKRTIGALFDEALTRYFARKQANFHQASVVVSNA